MVDIMKKTLSKTKLRLGKLPLFTPEHPENINFLDISKDVDDLIFDISSEPLFPGEKRGRNFPDCDNIKRD
jgi:hypothetical protein